ncbi:MAG: hypothetical protein IT162_17635 [Bryobacterales bacterium]|nr:hypothetical protein [Bryobacterales bacterium]
MLCRSLLFGFATAALAAASPNDAFLNDALAKARRHLAGLPDFVCAQTVERSERGPRESAFRLRDRLQLEVTSINGQERFARADRPGAEDRELRFLVTRGVTTTGGFSAFLRQITKAGAADFRFAAEATLDGRRLRHYLFQVPEERSAYIVSAPPHEGKVPFHGALYLDAESAEVLRLEVTADEISPELGFERTRTTVQYRLTAVGPAQHWFAAEAETLVAALDGAEFRNRAVLGDCRRYAAESKISFAGEEPSAPSAALQPAARPIALRKNLLVDIALDQDLDFATAAGGSILRASLAEPLQDGELVLAPAGAKVQVRLLEVARVAKPVDRYELVLRLESLEHGAATTPLSAKLLNTGSAPGLIKQERRLMPAFQKKRGDRFSLLARESNPEQTVLYWEARQPRVRKGFRLRWLTDSVD